MLGGDPSLDLLTDALRPLRSGDGFAATPRGTRYFDDNAWLGLAFLRLDAVTADPTWREAAHALARFVAQGEDPDGGVRWAEGSSSRNTCSTASAAWLVLESGTPDAPATAGRWMDWLDRTLRRPDGLYADRVDGGVVHDEVWTYNQGAALAAIRSLGRPTAALRSAILAHWSAAGPVAGAAGVRGHRVPRPARRARPRRGDRAVGPLPAPSRRRGARAHRLVPRWRRRTVRRASDARSGGGGAAVRPSRGRHQRRSPITGVRWQSHSSSVQCAPRSAPGSQTRSWSSSAIR